MYNDFMKKKQVIIIGVVLAIGLGIGISQFVQSNSNQNKKTQKTQTKSNKTKSKTTPKKVKTISTEEKILSKMSLEEKIGQMFLARVPFNNQANDIKKYKLGGYLFFAKDFANMNTTTLKQKVDSFQKLSNIKMFIGSDEEGGSVTRISPILKTPFKSPKELFKIGGYDEIIKDAKNKAEVLKSVGFNAPLYPVADLTTNPNGFMYPRSLGNNAAQTSKYVEKVVKALDGTGVMSTLKHFPGYGNNADSHIQIIHDSRDLKTIKNNDFKTFQAGIDAGADSILVAHNIVEKIDPKLPASISPKVHDVIRNEMNFNGVIMTDDLDMKGIANFTSQLNAGFQAIKSGNDIVLSSTYAQQIPYIAKKVRNNELSEKEIDKHVMRILKLKNKLHILETK